ncbi:hypothetical protein [Serratia sp. UGAL515B_01]|nr:hypothetical protein [Serratia sp. UGAL515B_01]WON76925.1 hypothetical protein OK023_17385 [Serratia sp. UGAL515B_01]
MSTHSQQCSGLEDEEDNPTIYRLGDARENRQKSGQDIASALNGT